MKEKNHMREIADMLGVEMDEEFGIAYGDTVAPVQAKITADGLMTRYTQNRSYWLNDKMLVELLCVKNEICIKRTPWKPKYRHTYYYVGNDSNVWEVVWYGATKDYNSYKLGNCYRTREEAESNKEKWKRFYASDEVLEVD